MKANRSLIKKANKIAVKYSRWARPIELQEMYQELSDIGVTVGMMSNGAETCEWYFDGEEVENSLFVLQTYKDYNRSESKNEYNIYFS